MADPIALFVDGLVSAVLGYVIATLVHAFVGTLETLGTPWYFVLLYIVVVGVAVAAEVINHVVGSFSYAAGFLYGAYLIHDWLSFGLVLALTILVIYAKAND
jgi:hypothetical protein